MAGIELVSSGLDAAAGALARLVPLQDGSLWAPLYHPTWPKDYTKAEQRLRMEIARAAVSAYLAALSERRE